MENKFVLLTEKEAMWAEMLVQVLKDNKIPCTTVPVYGAGMTLRAGIQERLKVYVPDCDLERAQELKDELFIEKQA